MPKKAALLLNLGSPASTSVSDVRTYLREFLNDERVIDSPALVRWLVLNLFILPTRPKNSAEAYEQVWTEEGSPLLVTSAEQQRLVREAVGDESAEIALAMRYGSPSIPEVVGRLLDSGVEELFVLPLYPHYAMSSYETVVVRVMDIVQERAPQTTVRLLQPFYDDPVYIDALVQSARPYLDAAPYDTVLFSYHGIPERHLRKSDPSHAHCLSRPDCCELCHPAHATCYRHQCRRTTELFIEAAGLDPKKTFLSFQSRLGRDPWLKPYTDHTLEEFGAQKRGRLLVMTPAFVADCLETLEEIAMQGKESYEESGGGELVPIPCLNTHPAFIALLAGRIEAWLSGDVAFAESGSPAREGVAHG